MTAIKKLLLAGKDGQVGWELQRSLAPLGILVSIERREIDLTNLEAVRNCIKLHQPDFIVNAAAYTAVDKAEIEQEKAYAINAHAVRVLAEEAARLNAWLFHYSTDYVFDGEKHTPYIETDRAFPLSVYGKSKLEGEQAIRDSGCKHLIFRSSWVYSVHGVNFPLTILRRAMAGDQIEVVNDCVGAPTSASLIADITAQLLYRIAWDPISANSASGTYHLVASGKTSWYEFAQFLLERAMENGIPLKICAKQLFPTSNSAYKASAKRPQKFQVG